MTPEQCRAARAMLNWSQDKLAEASKISVITVRTFELGKSKPQQSTMYLMRQALEQEGIEFTNGDAPGVRLRKPR
jgi:transcriptional regulator with XRE-family HTH domain